MIRALLAIMLLAAALPAAAHKLNVFAFVEGSMVVVEAKFSTGRIPNAGEVRVFDASEELVETLELGEDGTVRFPLTEEATSGGLLIEVQIGEDGHENYWLLTPDDITRGREGG